MAEPKRTVRFQFPVTPERIPQYINITLANHINDDVVLDFGFLDPFCLPAALPTNGAEPSGVLVQPVVRVAMNARVAEQLYQQLHNVLSERRRQRLPGVKHYPHQPPSV
ncbi:hypothetical protein LQF76_13395 [Gloeomargaritales cyanobacterium VI4D9]|nr:hypothetical protein LQF76_13395 [Gloeomargaritales cyanobacterium VI4D9]